MLYFFFSEDVRELGFSVVIDMRGNSSWSTVKPILKVYLIIMIIIMINIRINIMIIILISILIEQKYLRPWVLDVSDKHPLVSRWSLPSQFQT